MGRPPLPPGTYGEIRVRERSPGRHEARAQWRGEDGRTHWPACTADTPTAARNKLRTKLKEWEERAAEGDISPDTFVSEIAALYLAEIKREADKGVRSPQTPRLYRSWWTNHIEEALGALRCRELERKVTRCDKLIQRVHDEHSYDSAKTVRTVLSGLCGYAVRHGAMKVNPIRSAARLARGRHEVKEVVALSDEQRADLLARLAAYATTRERDAKGRRTGHRVLVWRDLSELAEAMLATGVRISEDLALSGADVLTRADLPDELEDGQVAVRVDAHIVRDPGNGLLRLPGRKGGAAGLLLIVPVWSVSMFLRRKLAAGPDGPLFASLSGGWLDPSNAGNRIKDAIKETDLQWVTPHVFRKTVSDDLDQAGLSQSEIANQLGNTVAVVERHYRKKRPTNQRAAAALNRRAPKKGTGS